MNKQIHHPLVGGVPTKDGTAETSGTDPSSGKKIAIWKNITILFIQMNILLYSVLLQCWPIAWP
jgi:hypothetical protein